MKLLDLQNVNLTYFSDNGETQALKDINFSVNSGDFVSIVGPSGCGKTTILSIISGLIKPTNGTITINNNSKFIGYMFQKDNLFEWRTIFKNITIGLELKGRVKKEDKERIIALLDKYGLKEFKDKHPSELSGGMRQRVG